VKINFLVRAKNPYFWVGLLGVVLTAMGVAPEMFTSWTIVVEQFKALMGNPFMLCSVIMAIVGVLLDPTTAGVNDSMQALEYMAPKATKNEECNDGN